MAIPVSQILGGLSLVPEIIDGAKSVFGAITGFFGGSPAAAGVTASQAALLSGGTAGRTLSTGTSVGPIGALAGGGFQTAVEVGTALAPIVARRLNVPVPAFLQQEAAAGRAAGGVRTVSRRQLILMTARAASPGATSKKIIRSAKECGIELAAATFGLNVLDVCFLLAQPASRRSRGISAADMRRTRSTIRKVTTIQRQLKALSGPIRRRG